MSDVIYKGAEGHCSETLREICFGCPAQDLVDQISSEPEEGGSKHMAEFFNNAFTAAREIIAENPNASQKEIDERMGEYGPQTQDGMQKSHGDLDKSQVATMAKNCAIARSKGRCIIDIAAARENRSKKTS